MTRTAAIPRMGLLVVSLIWCSASDIIAQERLVAHYPFDEGSGSIVRDASGHGNDGTIHGAEYVALQDGYALQFDGEDDHVVIPPLEAHKLPNSVTVEVWVNTEVATIGGILTKNGCGLMRNNYSLRLQEGGVLFESVRCPDQERFVMADPITTDHWHHIIGTCDGTVSKVYVDGKLNRTRTFDTFTIGTHDGPIYIGTNYYGGKPSTYYTGQIDDVRIYNGVLSDEQVLAHYRAGKDQRISQLTVMQQKRSSFNAIDTTPPTVSLASPPPDSTAFGEAIISARFADTGSGIDTSSAKIHLDGRAVTAEAKVTTEGFSLQTAEPLARGIHQVEVTVSDRATNRSNRLKWRFGVNTPVAVDVQFENGACLVNGQPFFPMGIYCGNTSIRREKLGYLAEATEAGINYALDGEVDREYLDTYLRNGMKVLRAVTFAAPRLAEGDSRQMDRLLEAKDHPALLGWWTEYTSEAHEKAMLELTYRYLKDKDKHHPVIYMHTWAGRISDAYYVYAYPIMHPVTPGNNILNVYETLSDPLEASASEGKGKPVWFISQAFDYRLGGARGKIVALKGGFRPSREEIRAMNYLALAKRANGLLYYAPGAEIPNTRYIDDFAIRPRQWTEALKIAREVRHLAPDLSAGAAADSVRLKDNVPGIHYRELIHNGVHTLIAVNVTRDLLLANWVFDSPSQPRVVFEDRILAESDHAMTDLFMPLEVHIYQW